jgi:Kelch motif
MAVAANYTLPTISDGAACSDDTWTATSTTNAPDARAGHMAVWTGSEMIVCGGWNGVNSFNTGGKYNPSTDSWMATSATNAPTARYVHTAVSTGGEMIVWGGYTGSYFNTGGRYCVESGSPTPAPTATATPHANTQTYPYAAESTDTAGASDSAASAVAATS